MKKIFSNRLILVVLLICISIPAICRAEATSEDSRAKLEKAIFDLWVKGPQAESLNLLESLASDPQKQISIEALFHLGCSDLLSGNRSKAVSRLEAMKKLSDNQLTKDKIVQLERMINPAGVATKTIEVNLRDTPISEALQSVAEKLGKAIIIDSKVSKERVSMHLSSVSFDQVLKILSDVGSLESKLYGDILFVTSKQPSYSPINGNESLLTLDFQDVDLRTTLRMIAQKAGINLVVHKNVTGKISIHLEKVAPQEALKLIAKANDLFIEKDGDVYMVMFSGDVSRISGKADFSLFQPKYIDVREAMNLIENEKILGLLIDQKGTDTIVLKGQPEAVEKAKSLLMTKDAPQKPIMITAKIWEINDSSNFSLDEFSKSDEQSRQKIANLLSSPRIITLPSRTATIEIGQDTKGEGDAKFPYQVRLDLRPFVLSDGLVQIDMKGEIKTKKAGKDSSKKMTSTFVVKPNIPFLFEVQGGTVFEVLVKNPEN
ncbi:MAG: hypothetical protein HQM08_14330 [Candidatus Riflebacteria bacterium]|nr:hypothetical protein [Candidatus Riflebacteria bacterium]